MNKTKYTIAFLTNCYIDDSCIPKLNDYAYWKSLVSKIYKMATDFEIRCWSGELDAIESGNKFGTQIENSETKELVFKGKMTPDFMTELLKNCLTEAGKLKWFTLNLYCKEKVIFGSEHYGTQPYLFEVTYTDVDKIKQWALDFPEIERVDVFDSK